MNNSGNVDVMPLVDMVKATNSTAVQNRTPGQPLDLRAIDFERIRDAMASYKKTTEGSEERRLVDQTLSRFGVPVGTVEQAYQAFEQYIMNFGLDTRVDL